MKLEGFKTGTVLQSFLYEPLQRMTKPTKRHVRPVKTQISLGIRQVWSESLLSARRILGSLATHWAHSEDSDQTGRMPSLIWVFAGRTYHFVGFVVRWLVCLWDMDSLQQHARILTTCTQAVKVSYWLSNGNSIWDAEFQRWTGMLYWGRSSEVGHLTRMTDDRLSK